MLKELLWFIEGYGSDGSNKSVVDIFEGPCDAFVHTIVMDDNSSTSAKLGWHYKEAIEAGLLHHWPVTAGGEKKDSNGELPIGHKKTKLLIPI